MGCLQYGVAVFCERADVVDSRVLGAELAPTMDMKTTEAGKMILI